MQTIHLGDTCDRCKTALFGDDDIFATCRNCRARFCSQCSEVIRAASLCSKCGRPPDSEYIPPRTQINT